MKRSILVLSLCAATINTGIVFLFNGLDILDRQWSVKPEMYVYATATLMCLLSIVGIGALIGSFGFSKIANAIFLINPLLTAIAVGFFIWIMII